MEKLKEKMPSTTSYRVFPRPFTHGGDLSPPPPPHMEGTSVGGQSVNGEAHEGGGPNFDRLYHKLKVLLLLSRNYTMQFIGYDSVKTRSFISYRFQIRTITQHQCKRIGAINRIV